MSSRRAAAGGGGRWQRWGENATCQSLNFSQFVARQHWLWRYASPNRL